MASTSGKNTPAKKAAATKKAPAKRASSRATTDPARPADGLRCEDCGRPLQTGEDPAIAETGGCIRCQHEAAYPGRDYDVDARTAEAKGMRLYTYMLGQQAEGLA